MGVSYKKLQHILIEREISHSQLMRVANISANMFFARPFCIKLQKLFVGRCSCIL